MKYIFHFEIGPVFGKKIVGFIIIKSDEKDSLDVCFDFDFDFNLKFVEKKVFTEKFELKTL